TGVAMRMDEQRSMLADAVGRLFRDAAITQAAVADGWNAQLAQGVEALGLPLLLVPADAGGFGGCWEDAFVVLQAVGFHAIALPIGETMVAARLLATAGLDVPAGLLGLAAASDGRVVGGRASSAMLFTGELSDVPWGADIDNVVAVVDAPDEKRADQAQRNVLRLTRAQATSTRIRRNLAGEPRVTLHFENAPAVAAHCPCPEAAHLRDYCALLRVAQAAGALEAALVRSVRYAKERVQFGRPIGTFQAIQHQLAILGSEAAAVACAARAACHAADQGDAPFEIAAAKLRTNLAIDTGAGIAHQVHGAIGFTREYDLRHSTQRLWSWRSEFGNDHHWSERLGTIVAARGAAAFWPDLTAREAAR
ncbi:MAG TPA: acyl-CoA dehydrogenase family protein, partial [Burkholderiaceae bacterium]|nr:acyl-CoA dehydrogenase family protein [Burkholderiaceae bacterium]